jgi:hypothetical protein
VDPRGAEGTRSTGIWRKSAERGPEYRATTELEGGKKQGKRFIQGGRCQMRRSLHMAAMVAARHNPVLKDFYQKLLKAGKPFKVAIVAVTRKLLIHLNSIMAKILENPVAV